MSDPPQHHCFYSITLFVLMFLLASILKKSTKEMRWLKNNIPFHQSTKKIYLILHNAKPQSFYPFDQVNEMRFAAPGCQRRQHFQGTTIGPPVSHKVIPLTMGEQERVRLGLDQTLGPGNEGQVAVCPVVWPATDQQDVWGKRLEHA